jgi:glutamate-1-semialdehyde 2,1-aminomutase
MSLAACSHEMFEKLKEVVPGGVNSPVRSFKGLGLPPMVADKGEADTVIDVDGRLFIDYCMSWGALMHGHAHSRILQAVTERMSKGTSFGISTAVEEMLARKVVGLMDSVDKVRFVSSGTEATMTAVRLARGFTRRDIVVKFTGNYHGHADFFLVKAGSGVAQLAESSSAGIPQDVVKHVVSLTYNDVDGTRKYLRENEVACVILEPVAGNMGLVPASIEFLQMLREETDKQGALLIFDEVMSGFRVGIQGAQGLYGICPDLTCFGKVIGGGLPVAAFGGKAEVMDYLAPDGPVYQAGTLSGNPLAMEAGYQALTMLETPGFFEEMERKADLITRPVSQFIKQSGIHACVQQSGSMFTLFFGQKTVKDYDDALKLDTDIFAEFFRYMFENGIYIPPSQFEAWFVSSVHTDAHLQRTADLAVEFLRRLS